MQFDDLKFSKGKAAIVNMTSEAKTYLDAEFRGTRTFEFTVADPVTVSKGFAHYGANSTDRFDAYAFEAAEEACKAIAKTTPFSTFDNDGDGYVDHIMIVFPGRSEADGAGDNYFWPQQSHFSDFNIHPSCGGSKLDSFAAVCELDANGNAAGAGNFCHELIHGFHIPDFYDTDGELSGGLCAKDWASVSLMNEGNHNDGGHTPPGFRSLELNLLGIASGTKLTKGHHSLSPIGKDADYLIVNADTENKELFLIENIQGFGLSTFHVDRSEGDALYSDRYKKNLSAAERWSLNQVNCNPAHQCAELSQSTSFRFWDGSTSPLVLTNIVNNTDGTIVFDAVEPVCEFSATVYQDAALLKWMSGIDAKDITKCSVSLQAEGICANPKETEAPISPDGKVSLMINGLKAKTNYLANIHIRTIEGGNFTIAKGFTTKARMAGTVPFIHLAEETRNPDGSFRRGAKLPLVIYNAEGVAEVRWSFNDKPIDSSPDGTFTIESGGRLKAEIFFENGEKESILKEMRVR